MSNTSEHIPFESIAPIMLENSLHPEYPFFSGTGFFVQFPPFEDIYFVTAKHCILDNKNKEIGKIKIPYIAGGTEAINFSEILTANYIDDKDGELEDVTVYIVGEITSENRSVLEQRSLKLSHQDDVNKIINHIIEFEENVRTVGFPSVSKSIDYPEKSAISQPRGFYGKITNDSKLRNRYKINILNWKENGLGGFSGAPILSLHPTTDGDVQSLIIGMLLTGSSTTAEFISINVVTDLIADYIKQK